MDKGILTKIKELKNNNHSFKTIRKEIVNEILSHYGGTENVKSDRN